LVGFPAFELATRPALKKSSPSSWLFGSGRLLGFFLKSNSLK
jgi:hypothetical protein